MEITRWTTCLFVAILNFAEVLGQTYEFGKDHLSAWKYFDEDDTIHVVYNGKDVSVYDKLFTFKGQGSEIMDEYQVCVTPASFTDPDCAVQIYFKTSFKGEILQSVTCLDNKNWKFCGSQDGPVFIFFEKLSGKDTSNAKFTLRVTATKVYDYGALVGAIVGGVMGGLVLIGLLCGAGCWILCNKVAEAESSKLNDQPTSVPTTNVSTNNAFNTSDAPTGNNVNLSHQKYPAGYNPQPPFESQPAGDWPPLEKQASSPPPSYDTAM